MKEQVNKGLDTIAAKLLVPAISAIVGMGGGAWLFEPVIANYTAERILNNAQVVAKIKEVSVQEGGFRSLLEEETGISKKEMPRKFAEAFMWMDSLKLYNRKLMPMLEFELRNYDVGLKVDKITGRIMYRHTNGHLYRAVLNTEYYKYYFINDEGLSEWCK